MTSKTEGRTFAYLRVSTADLTTDNQAMAIQSRGYNIEPHRIVTETISGGVPASKRPGFTGLLAKLERGDTLVVLKLDRLGRDSIDIQQTVRHLTEAGVRLVSLDLGNQDLTSGAGKLLMQMLAAFAEMERDRIRERTREGLERAKAQGKKMGRPAATKVTKAVAECTAQGFTIPQTARALGISVATVSRHRALATSALAKAEARKKADAKVAAITAQAEAGALVEALDGALVEAKAQALDDALHNH